MMSAKLGLCTVWGEKHNMLPHFIAHYKALGVSEFFFTIHAEDKHSPHVLSMQNELHHYGIQAQVYIGPWNGAIGTKLINELKSKYPNHWFVVADQDELQVYPERLDQVISRCEDLGLTYVTGLLLDRVSENGAMSPIRPGLSVWKQFPNCGFITFPLTGANPYKITLCKGFVELSEGQHGVVTFNKRYPSVGPVMVQVHHFKWEATLEERLKKRLVSKQKGHWKNSYEGYADEVQRIINYLSSYSGCICLLEPLFLIEKADHDYESYKNWRQLQSFTSSWSRLQSYPKLSWVNI